jgi:hypothetical protein
MRAKSNAAIRSDVRGRMSASKRRRAVEYLTVDFIRIYADV